ncbi:MAG: exodeoxyribonuclease V subunit beta [Deltaproteobacteria bacterium]|nr:exodeoxyribonuclease V subunit beta [Deltaproteobacteria bacterium]
MGNLLDPLTFPLHGVRLIEASAGTGKTYTIAALYLRLILGHGGENAFSRPLTPPEILVVTFTNAATEELRDRIRGRLTEAAAFFRGQGREDAYLKALRDDYDAGMWPGCARLLDQAAQWMDESAIHTIHAWCQQMIRQHAFDSGGLFDLELAASDRDFLEEAACDYWRSHFYPQPKEVLSELTTLCATPQALVEKILPLLKENPGPADDPFAVIEKRRQAIEGARRIWESDFAAAIERVLQAQSDKTLNGNKYRTDSLAKWVEALSAWVKDKGPLPDAQALEKFSSSGLKAGTARNKTVPEHPAYEALDCLNEKLGALDVDTALFNHAAKDIGQRIRQEKERSAQMGFDDLLTRLHEALYRPGNERLARVIREQFPAALIDEFQDTDPVQYAIFGKIYLGQGMADGKQRAGDGANHGEQAQIGISHSDAALFMIGDPKQAIYAFRGADIHTYLAARRDSFGAPYTLGKNFRSAEGLVKAVNQVFGAASEHLEGAFLFKDRIPFVAVAAEGRKDLLKLNGKPVLAMTFWQLQQTGFLNKTGPDGYIGRMAESVAGEIAGMLNSAQAQPARTGFQAPDGAFKALRPADIAILVRNGSEAGAIRQALNKRRVRSVYLSDKDSVFDAPEAKSLLFLLQACAEPEREGALRTALATDVLALSFNRLDQLVQDELAWEAEVERFRNYQQIWRHQGVLPMLRLLLREFGVPSRLLPLAGGERVLTNLLHLAEMLQAAATGLNGEHALIRWLTEQIERPGIGVEEQILRLESDEELIRVVTIHKSKGLEYPLVFLPFICSFRQVTARNTPVVRIRDEKGRMRLVQKPGPEDLESADRERLAEDLRMLYVALTRAQYACWLGIGVMGKTSRLHLSGLGYLLSAGETISADQLAEKLVVLKGNCEHIAIEPLPEPGDTLYRPRSEAVNLTPALTFTGNIPHDWWITSYSGMLAGARMAESDLLVFPDSHSPVSAKEDQLLEAETEPVAAAVIPDSALSIHGFPRGPEPGTFLHDILEWAAREGFVVLAPNRSRILYKVRDFCERRDWKDWDEILTDWLQKLLRTRITLPDASGEMMLSGLSMEDYQAELEFLFASHEVNARWLDDAVTAAILPQAPRPRLRELAVNGMLKGFIDLVFCYGERYYVLDYKSNYLGENQAAYAAKAMEKAMLEHRYDLQYVLYTLALHRLLKARLPGYDYDRHVGGAVYLFLRGVNDRGQGIYLDKPPQALIEALDQAFAGRKRRHAL